MWLCHFPALRLIPRWGLGAHVFCPPHPFLIPQPFLPRQPNVSEIYPSCCPLPKKSHLLTGSLEQWFSPGMYKKCREQAIWRDMKTEGHTLSVSARAGEGSEGSSVVFLLAKVTPDRGLINGATFTGTLVRHFDICKSFV